MNMATVPFFHRAVEPDSPIAVFQQFSRSANEYGNDSLFHPAVEKIS